MATMHAEGYVVVYDKGKRRLEHRVVMERLIGRELLPDEIVHHVDGDRGNNDPANLILVSSQAEHMRLHRRTYASSDARECSICHQIKPRSEFYPSNNSADPHHPHCKSCQKKRKRMQYTPRPNDQRKRKMVEFDGEAKTIANWSRDPRCAVPFGTLFARINYGWSMSEALSTPSRRKLSGSR